MGSRSQPPRANDAPVPGPVAGASRTSLIIAFVLLAMLAAGSAAQWETGLADNGDYTRQMLWVSSGPQGLGINFPKEGTDAWRYRFYQHPLAYWKLDFPLTSRWVSSVLPLWIPGVLANMVLYHPGTLYLPYLSLGPRILCLFFLFLLFRWIRRRAPGQAAMLSLTFGIPAMLILGNRDLVAYFTSFYQEPASLISLLFLLGVLMVFRRRGDVRWMPWLLSAAVFGIQAAKLSNAYWAGLIMLFVFPWPLLRDNRKRAALYLMLVFFLPFGLSLGQAAFYHASKVNAYQSLYCGVLVFSDRPQEHLARIGMPDGMQYLDHHAYGREGRECVRRYADKLTHRMVLDVIAHEPVLAWRMLTYAADSVQRLELTHLGKRMAFNTGDAPREWKAAQGGIGDNAAFALWSEVKSRVFPRGPAFLFSLGVLVLLFLLALRRGSPLQRDLAWVGLLLTLACAGDMWMQIFGDGKRDLIKHLFLVNLLYDIALITAMNVVVLFFRPEHGAERDHSVS